MDETLRVDIHIRNNYIRFVILWIFTFIPICGASGVLDTVSCPSMCVCARVQGYTGDINVDCTGKNLTNVPQDIDVNTIRL